MKTFAYLRKIKALTAEWYCGYVGIVEGVLPESRMSSSDPDPDLDNMISVHGGITYDEVTCIHRDIIPITVLPKNGLSYDTYRIIGFDIAHPGDRESGLSRNYDYALKETQSLQEQLESLLITYNFHSNDKYVVVQWPEVQELMNKEGFRENSYLINDSKGMDDFGSSAYFVKESWLND